MKKVYLFTVAIFCLFTAALSQTIISTNTGGDWSNPATWIGAVVPTITDSVIIADGAVVTIDVPSDALTLTVGQGVSGVLRFADVTAQSLTVAADAIISNGGTFRTQGSGTETGHELIIGGNLTNNGNLNFSTNANTAGAGITFTGNGNAVFNGTGPVTDILRITIDKGADPSAVLELSTDVFTFRGATVSPSTDPGFLNLVNGTFKISGVFSMSNSLFAGTGSYTITPSTGIWFNNTNFTALARPGTAYLEGTLIMDAGTYNVGTNFNDRLGYIIGTVVTIHGGAVNVASRFSATTTFGLTYTQTGGTFTVNTVGSTSAGFASFDMRSFDNSTFSMSGGTIVLENASQGGAGPRDYNNRPINANITGGTLQIGNGNTAATQTFFLQGVAPDLLISNTSAGHIAQLAGDMTVLNTTINPGTTLKLDDGATGYTYMQQGVSFTNTGILDGTVAGSRLAFAGTAAQTYNGDGGTILTPLASLQFNNASGVTIGNTVASDIITNELVMTAGDVLPGINTIVLGTGTTSTGTLTYASGTIVGKFRRWINAITAASDFPVGIAGITRNANINFTSAPAIGGTLTAQFISLPGGANGLPLIDGVNLVTNSSGTGYWSMLAGDGLAGGTYTGTFNANSFPDIIDYTQLVLLKRANNLSPWVLDGTHVPTTGSNAFAVLSRTNMSGFSEFGVGGNLTSLPITIQYFTGKKEAGSNRLDWKVSCTNTASATIVLERSNDARKFVTINSISATALRCLQPFNYTDLSPAPGINYYRLKLIDADGKFTYSTIIALLNKDKGFDIVSFMPNPVIDVATLSVAGSSVSQLEIVITDMTGKRIAKHNAALIAGSNLISLNFSGLAKGTYQLTGYTNDGEAKTISFIKN